MTRDDIVVPVSARVFVAGYNPTPNGGAFYFEATLVDLTEHAAHFALVDGNAGLLEVGTTAIPLAWVTAMSYA